MADFSKFRSSLGGFHRGDVATYIETLCRTHGAELKERDGRIESLTAALAEGRLLCRVEDREALAGSDHTTENPAAAGGER